MPAEIARPAGQLARGELHQKSRIHLRRSVSWFPPASIRTGGHARGVPASRRPMRWRIAKAMHERPRVGIAVLQGICNHAQHRRARIRASYLHLLTSQACPHTGCRSRLEAITDARENHIGIPIVACGDPVPCQSRSPVRREPVSGGTLDQACKLAFAGPVRGTVLMFVDRVVATKADPERDAVVNKRARQPELRGQTVATSD